MMGINRMQKSASLELLLHFILILFELKTLQGARTLYSKTPYVFCFSILKVFGGKMMSQD